MNTSAQTTVAQYDEMIAAGQFEPREEPHVELLEGAIVPTSRVDPLRSRLRSLLTEWSYDRRPELEVSIRGPSTVWNLRTR